MIPPLATLMESTPAVTALLGTNPTRFFPDKYPENLELTHPYAVYRVVGGLPPNQLGGSPGTDNVRVQIDIYGQTLATAKAAYEVIRDAVETVSDITSFNIGGVKDPDSNSYRFSFDISYWLPRS